MKEEPSKIEQEFFSTALAEKQRLDQRQFLQWRPINISLGPEFGLAIVQIGYTRFADI